MTSALTAALVAALLLAWVLAVPDARGEEIRFTVTRDSAGRLDPRLFGHFLERASWGEPGPEGALVPGTNDLLPEVVEHLKAMRVSIIRFPGGTDIDYIDWTDLVSSAPGREGKDRPVTIGHTGKPITNRFGLDEYFKLRDTLGCETILLVNWLDAVSKKKPLREAALKAAGLVAYCNAPVGAKLPDGMPDWPAVRASSGHPAPFGVKLFQIGNEWYGFRERALKAAGVGNDKAGAAWYVECLNAYVDLMRAVDPTIEFIVDGVGGPGDPLMGPFLEDASVRKKVRYATFHAYGPGEMGDLKRGGKVVSFDGISQEDLWRVWIATPGSFSERGEDLGFAYETAWVMKLGYRAVCTEWNWNGWGDQHRQARLGMDPDAAKAIGAAGFLHGLMRFAGDFDLACQSNLIGCGWAIGGVQVDPEGRRPVHYSPTGQVTMFYTMHHGNRVLKVSSGGVPTYAQPYQLGAARELGKVMLLDAVASADDKALYFHAISREFAKPVRVVIDLAALGRVGPGATHYVMEGRLNAAPAAGEKPEVMAERQATLKLDGGMLAVDLPPRSVSCIEIPIQGKE